MNITLPYGRRKLIHQLDFRDVMVINPEEIPRKTEKTEKNIQNCFLNLTKGLEIPQFNKKNIAIAVNDQTRPLPYDHFLVEFIKGLISNFGEPANIEFFIATGTHTPLTRKEIYEILPLNITKNYSISSHDSNQVDNLIFLGETRRNRTPVFVNKEFFMSDTKIVIGNIAPHHFMGYSGGVKTAAIGLAGRQTIETNHALISHPNAKMGLFKSNPMRMDVEEIGKMMGVDYAFNLILDHRKIIKQILFGIPFDVMISGIQYLYNYMHTDISEYKDRFDLVIATPGGYPKDINLYQAQKAITHAEYFVKPQGVIILVAQCEQGYGSNDFEYFFKGSKTPDEVIHDFEMMKFKIGPHKAFQIAQQAKRNIIFLVSDIPSDDYSGSMMILCNQVEEALSSSWEFLPANPHVAVLPYAINLMPKILDI